jgi:hypothetical protein
VKVIGCDFKIKAVDPINNEERYTLFPDPDNAEQFKPLALLVEAPEGLPLNNYDFEWSNTAGAAISDIHAQSIAATLGGVYKVRISPFDNPNVGCVASVVVDEFMYERKLWKLSEELVINGVTNVTSLPVELVSGSTKKVLNNRVYKKELIYSANRVETVYIIPFEGYLAANNDLINPSNFTGITLHYNKFSNEFLGGWRYNNGISFGRVFVNSVTGTAELIDCNCVSISDNATLAPPKIYTDYIYSDGKQYGFSGLTCLCPPEFLDNFDPNPGTDYPDFEEDTNCQNCNWGKPNWEWYQGGGTTASNEPAFSPFPTDILSFFDDSMNPQNPATLIPLRIAEAVGHGYNYFGEEKSLDVRQFDIFIKLLNQNIVREFSIVSTSLADQQIALLWGKFNAAQNKMPLDVGRDIYTMLFGNNIPSDVGDFNEKFDEVVAETLAALKPLVGLLSDCGVCTNELAIVNEIIATNTGVNSVELGNKY